MKNIPAHIKRKHSWLVWTHGQCMGFTSRKKAMLYSSACHAKGISAHVHRNTPEYWLAEKEHAKAKAWCMANLRAIQR